MATATGKCYTYRGLKFYAKSGFICLHDEETGEFYSLTRKEFLERAAALNQEAAKMRVMSAASPAQAKWLSSDRADLQDGVEMMLQCTQDAKEQGDRMDPEVNAWFTKHRPDRKARVSLNGAINFNSQLPGDLPLGRVTGRHCLPDFSVNQGQSGKKKLILPGDA